MKRFKPFIVRHLEPADRLGEALFGLIMALGFSGAVSIGAKEPNNRTMLLGILGCNLAWAIVDGVMYVLTALFERGRRMRIRRAFVKAPNEETVIQWLDRELGDQLQPLTSEPERQRIYRWMVDHVRRGPREKTRVEWRDLSGAVAVALTIVVATIPVVIPFILIASPKAAMVVSNLVALGLLFSLGCWWAHEVGASPLRIGTCLTLTGVALVLVTVALGG